MYFLIIAAALCTAWGARLDNVYLPPQAQSAGGASAGLQTPFEADQYQNYDARAQSSAQSYGGQSSFQSQSAQAEILRFENEINENEYHYAYETSDGTKAEQQGRILPGSKPEEGSLQVSGSYSYIGDDGQTYTVTYVADENGFRAEGAHLPTPPPIPDAILKSLQLTAGGEAHYDSQKSSYDADAEGGY